MANFSFFIEFFLIIFSIIKTANFSPCLDVNEDGNPSLINCYSINIDSNNTDNAPYCCFLQINDKSQTINKCIEIKDIDNEDEISDKIDAFKIMFKDASEILIDCSYGYIDLKFLIIFLIIFCLFF